MRIFDTTAISEAILKKFKSKNEFYRIVRDNCNIPEKTIESHVNGRIRPGYEEIVCWSKLLDIPKEDIVDIYYSNAAEAENNTMSTSPKPIFRKAKTTKKTDKKWMEGKRFVANKLDDAIKSRGFKFTTVSKITGIRYDTFSKWRTNKYKPQKHDIEKIATLLGVSPDEFYEKIEEETTEQVTAATENTVSLPNQTQLQDAGNEQNVLKMLKIISDNEFALANLLSGIEKRFVEEIEALKAEIESLKTTEKEDEKGKKDQNDEKIIPLPETKSEIKSETKSLIPDNPEDLITAFKEDDSYHDYSKKIHKMITFYANAKHLKQNAVYHQLYKGMNRIYGVVYEQETKEFRSRENRDPKGTMELLWSNAIWKNIFYCYVADEMQKALKTA